MGNENGVPGTELNILFRVSRDIGENEAVRLSRALQRHDAFISRVFWPTCPGDSAQKRFPIGIKSEIGRTGNFTQNTDRARAPIDNGNDDLRFHRPRRQPLFNPSLQGRWA